MSVNLNLNNKKTHISPRNLEGFEINDNGSAVKYFYLENEEGLVKRYSFRINFNPNLSENKKIEFLKKYSDNTIQTLLKMSVDLGVGTKYKGLSFGNNNQLSLHSKNSDEIKIIDKSNLDQFSEKKIRLFETVSYIFNKSLIKNDSLKNVKETDEIKNKRLEIANKIQKFKENYKDWYKDNIIVSIYYENLFDEIENQSLEVLMAFMKDARNFKK